MAYKHGVYGSEIPTSILPAVSVSAGLPVVFGTAPVNLATDPAAANAPKLCYTYAEAVAQFGYSDDWETYTLCEFIRSHFALFNVAPVVLVNVLDPEVHKTAVASTSTPMASGVAKIAVKGVVLSTLIVKATTEGTALVKNVDYTAAFNADGDVLITRIASGTIAENATAVFAAYSKLNPSDVDHDDIIGGVDGTSGEYTGLELVNRIFPLFRLLPGQILAPGWSQEPEVAAVMVAKASNINSHFKCIALTDVPTDTVKKYTDVAAWKETNNYVSPRQIVCWPKVKLGDDIYHLSTQMAGLICRTDASHDDIPYVVASNQILQANGAVLADGTEVNLGPEQAAYLNGQGIVTALNFIGGWRSWGVQTGCYPSNTDPKDAEIGVRRMFDWISNTLVTTFWQKVDAPINRRLVDTVLDSANIWLNGLAARQMILGGRVTLLQEENPVTDLMAGIIRFHVYATPASAAREMDFIIEYDPSYLSTLFGS